MGGKSSPDFGQVAAAQGEENRESVRDQLFANRPNQYTPWGYTNWEQQQVLDPATGEYTTEWTQTQGLTPELQDILNKQIAIQSGRSDIAGMLTGRLGNEFGQSMDWSGLNPMGAVPEAQYTRPNEVQTELGDPTVLRERAEDMVYGRGAQRLQGQFDAQRQGLETKLRNQGLGPEDAAWKAQMGALAQQETDAYGGLQQQALTQGLTEQQQLWNQGLQGGQFRNQALGQNFQQNLAANQQNFGQGMQQSAYANQLRQQQLTEAMQKRGFSLNEINALLSGQQVGMPQMPNFAQAAAQQPAPIYQAAVDQSNFDQASSPWGGLMNLGGTLGGAYLGTL